MFKLILLIPEDKLPTSGVWNNYNLLMIRAAEYYNNNTKLDGVYDIQFAMLMAKYRQKSDFLPQLQEITNKIRYCSCYHIADPHDTMEETEKEVEKVIAAMKITMSNEGYSVDKSKLFEWNNKMLRK